MTPADALALVLGAGAVEFSSDRLKIELPKDQFADLAPAIEVLRAAKAEVLSILHQQAEEQTSAEADVSAAIDCLNQNGVRIIDGRAVGIWSDLDSVRIRATLENAGVSHLPVMYLDAPETPDRYKLRNIPGDPVPDAVRRAMEVSAEPWKVRTGMPHKFVPWPSAETVTHTIDPVTKIWPVAQWGSILRPRIRIRLALCQARRSGHQTNQPGQNQEMVRDTKRSRLKARR
jgi:hypothetical protein